MKQTYKIPSKTFFLGEYSVLTSSKAIIYLHEPAFEVEVYKKENLKEDKQRVFTEFHPESPAGKLLSLYNAQSQVVFKDPHNSKGGFGGSTAEFIACALQLGLLESGLIEKLKKLSKLYDKIVFDDSSTYQPSGVDLMTQAYGCINNLFNKLVYIDKNTFEFKVLESDKFSISVEHTGYKLKTHEHLKELKIQDIFEDSNQNLVTALYGLKKSNFNLLKESFTMQESILNKHNLICENSKNLLKQKRQNHPEVLFKACGAMGSDTILKFHPMRP